MIWKKNKVKFEIIAKTNDEEHFSVRYGCITFVDSYRFLSHSLDELDKSLDENDFIILKREFRNNLIILNQELAYPYEYFNSVDDYQNSVDTLKKEDFFSKLKNNYPDDNEIDRRKEITKLIKIKIREQLTRLNMKTDITLLADVFWKINKSNH